MIVLKRLFVSFVSLFFVVALLLYVDEVRRAYLAYERDGAGYMGLNVGASADDVLYLLGYPQSVVGEPEPERVPGFGEVIWDPRVYQVNGKDPQNAIPAGKTINDYFRWEWERNNDRIDVTFDPKTRHVTKIACMADQSRWDWECPRIFGVNTETHEDEVRDLLGEPNWVKHDGVAKTLGYDELGLALTLTQQRVYLLEKTPARGASWQWKLKHILI
ncbi:MAG TPA: hypothetical protein VGU01_14710 [Sphingomicrobium sp.]|nr:hypothetical protein [Sphingomicrobium sp.]